MRVESGERLWEGWPGGTAPCRARAFGHRAEDLDVDFVGVGRPQLVSAVLALCLRAEKDTLAIDAIWSWTLAQRLQGLLVVALASHVPPLAFVQRCGACGESFEIEAAPAMFERKETDKTFDWSPEPNTIVHVSLPTGHAQRRWASGSEANLRSMARVLITAVNNVTPPSDWEVPPAWIDPLAQELERRDPLTALEIETSCPACGAPNAIEIDLEAELLARLHGCQRRTLLEIHRLASAYHWSESIILDLPVWRRRHYLAQLGAAGHA